MRPAGAIAPRGRIHKYSPPTPAIELLVRAVERGLGRETSKSERSRALIITHQLLRSSGSACFLKPAHLMFTSLSSDILASSTCT